jgi:hypothetical protein
MESLWRVLAAGNACGLSVDGVVKLALRPRHGVHEFFVSFIQGPGRRPWPLDEQTLRSIIEAPGIGRLEEE